MPEAIRESLMRMRVSHPFLIIQRLAVQSLSIFQFHEMSRASGGMYVLCMCMTLKRPCFMYYTFALSFVIVVIIINVIFIIIIIISHLFLFFWTSKFYSLLPDYYKLHLGIKPKDDFQFSLSLC